MVMRHATCLRFMISMAFPLLCCKSFPGIGLWASPLDVRILLFLLGHSDRRAPNAASTELNNQEPVGTTILLQCHMCISIYNCIPYTSGVTRDIEAGRHMRKYKKKATN